MYKCTVEEGGGGEEGKSYSCRVTVFNLYIFTRRIFYYRVNVMSGVKKMKVDEGVIKFLANKKETRLSFPSRLI